MLFVTTDVIFASLSRHQFFDDLTLVLISLVSATALAFRA
jgi:hypothetical protein